MQTCLIPLRMNIVFSFPAFVSWCEDFQLLGSLPNCSVSCLYNVLHKYDAFPTTRVRCFWEDILLSDSLQINRISFSLSLLNLKEIYARTEY